MKNGDYSYEENVLILINVFKQYRILELRKAEIEVLAIGSVNIHTRFIKFEISGT